MALNVIKKDGTKESFDSDKIKNSIRAATSEAGLSEDKKEEVVEQVTAAAMQVVGDKDEIETTELKNIILGELDKVEPVVADAWRKYDMEKEGI